MVTRAPKALLDFGSGSHPHRLSHAASSVRFVSRPSSMCSHSRPAAAFSHGNVAVYRSSIQHSPPSHQTTPRYSPVLRLYSFRPQDAEVTAATPIAQPAISTFAAGTGRAVPRPIAPRTTWPL